MLALTALLLLAPPQSSQVMEVLLRDSEPIPGLGPSSQIYQFYTPRAGRGGGWVASVDAIDSGLPNGHAWVAVGQRPGQLDGPVELLREPGVIQGLTQTHIYLPSMAGGLIAYVDDQYAPQRVWIEDQPIVAFGEIIGGTPGWTWQYFRQVELTTTGELLIYGTAAVAGSGSRDVLWRWPQEELLLARLQSLPGFGTISRFESYLSISPNGEHWSQVVRRGQGLDFGIVVDGQILEAAPSRPVIVGEAVPSPVAGSLGPSLWDTFQYPALLNDRGDWALEAYIQTLTGSQHSIIARNGGAFLDGVGYPSLIGIDARGAIINATGGTLQIEEQPIVMAPYGVDLDGDGAADPGSGICSSFGSYSVAPPESDALTLISTRLRENGSCAPIEDAILRARPLRVDVPLCEGVENSTGHPGQLVVGGTTRVAENEMTLQLFGLPVSAPCYALLSRTAGFVANPGGSQGNLCLGGGIGRMVLSLFVANAEGRGAVALDLTALREPTGYVAAMPGDRWYFQAWYRDSQAGLATSNFTSASAVVLD